MVSIYTKVVEAFSLVLDEVADENDIDNPLQIYSLPKYLKLRDEAVFRTLDYGYEAIKTATTKELLEELSYYEEVDDWDELITNAALYDTKWDFSRGHATSLRDIVAALIIIYTLSDINRFIRDVS